MSEANAGQRAEWNGQGGQRWVADADRRDVILQPVLDELLAASDVQPDEDVLDIGCGCGAATLAVARGLTTGTATGIDISSTMLAVARERAAGDDRVTLIEADAQTCSFTPDYDLVMSRFGTMFFADLAAAFANLRRAVRPNGRLCIATWQPLAENPWLTVPAAALADFTTPPTADMTAPGMFAQSDPDAVVATLTAAGWHDVSVEPRTVQLWLGADVAEAVDYLGCTGVGSQMIASVEAGHRAEALGAIAAALGEHVADGVRLAGGINIVRACAVSSGA